jgi:DNA polymerase-3 subunit epsilon
MSQPPELPARLAFVDLETTGATGAQDRITEIGIVRVGPEGVSEWSSLVNPETPISAFIEQLTGISNSMVAGAPRFAELAPKVRELLAGHLFVAHNARFDYGFVRHEFLRLGEVFRAPVLCTVKLSRKLYPEHHRHSLDTLIARHGLHVSARHRALGDAQLIHQFWTLHLTDAATQARLADAVDDLCAQTLLPPHLDAKLHDDLPEGRGVYVFYGHDTTGREQVIHIGRTKTLRTRVLGYFSRRKPPPAAKAALAERVQRVECYPVADEAAAIALEASLRRNLGSPPARGE